MSFTLLDTKESKQKANPLSVIVFSQTSKSLQDTLTHKNAFFITSGSPRMIGSENRYNNRCITDYEFCCCLMGIQDFNLPHRGQNPQCTWTSVMPPLRADDVAQNS